MLLGFEEVNLEGVVCLWVEEADVLLGGEIWARLCYVIRASECCVELCTTVGSDCKSHNHGEVRTLY